MKFQVDTELFPFESRFLKTANGAEVHYVDEGEGTVILMLHGNPTWSFLYRKMIGKLRHRFRCIAVDYPGFGLSAAPAGYDFLPQSHSQVLIEVVETLNLDNFLLVMQDWGGPIGLALAERFPERVRGLILGNTWAWPLKGQPKFERFSWLMGGPIGRWMARSFNGVWRVFMEAGFVNPPSRRELAMYEAPFRQPTNRIQTAIFPRQLIKSEAFEAAVEAGLKTLADKPALLLWGDRDMAFQDRELERFKTYFPNHSHHVLNASHFWQDDQGEVAAAFTIDWAQENGWIQVMPAGDAATC